MHLTKMEGLGNDYLYYYGEMESPAEVSVKYADRHFGIGSDGLILIQPSEIADFRMRIFNADGSEAKMCGNGIRCVGKYVYEKGYTDKTRLAIETGSGIRILELDVKDGKVGSVTVDMGKAEVDKSTKLKIAGTTVSFIPVSTGNPHAVIFTEDAENAPLETIGAEMEKHPFFPDGVNVEFVQRLSATRLRMRVWERGSAVTMACGTGACASTAAAVSLGLCPENTDISVQLDGGSLQIRVLHDKTVIMKGPANFICECEA